MSEHKEVSLLELVRRIHRGELTPEEAVQIFASEKAEPDAEPPA